MIKNQSAIAAEGGCPRAPAPEAGGVPRKSPAPLFAGGPLSHTGPMPKARGWVGRVAEVVHRSGVGGRGHV